VKHLESTADTFLQKTSFPIRVGHGHQGRKFPSLGNGDKKQATQRNQHWKADQKKKKKKKKRKKRTKKEKRKPKKKKKKKKPGPCT